MKNSGGKGTRHEEYFGGPFERSKHVNTNSPTDCDRKKERKKGRKEGRSKRPTCTYTQYILYHNLWIEMMEI